MLEQRKHPVKMSFWAENQSAKVMATVDPEPWAHAAARRLVAREPDGDLLAAMIFGAPA